MCMCECIPVLTLVGQKKTAPVRGNRLQLPKISGFLLSRANLMRGVSALAKEIKTLWHKILNLAEAGAGLPDSTSSGPTVHTRNHSSGCDDTAAFTGLTAQQAQHLRLDTQRPRDKLVLTACRLPHRLDHPICCGLYVPVLKSLCHFWDCTQAHHFRLFCWLWWLLHFF